MCSESWLLVVAVTWFVVMLTRMLDLLGQALQVNCSMGCLGQVGAAESYLRAGWDQWATCESKVEGWDPRPVTKKNMARWEIGMGKLFQQPSSDLPASCLFFQFLIHPLLEWSFKIAVPMWLLPWLKPLNNFPAHRKRPTPLYWYLRPSKNWRLYP